MAWFPGIRNLGLLHCPQVQVTEFKERPTSKDYIQVRAAGNSSALFAPACLSPRG